MPYKLETMTVNEIIEHLSKLPGDKLIELRSVIDTETFQLELQICLEKLSREVFHINLLSLRSLFFFLFS